MPRNIFEEMKYLEIMIVADHNTVGFFFEKNLEKVTVMYH